LLVDHRVQALLNVQVAQQTIERCRFAYFGQLEDFPKFFPGVVFGSSICFELGGSRWVEKSNQVLPT
jgi:hypothetical protein